MKLRDGRGWDAQTNSMPQLAAALAQEFRDASLSFGEGASAFGIHTSNSNAENTAALASLASTPGTWRLSVGGTITLSAAISIDSNVTIDVAAGTTIDATALGSPCITATSKSNIRLTGDGKIVCAAASVPSFTSCTNVSVSIRIEDSSGALLAATVVTSSPALPYQFPANIRGIPSGLWRIIAVGDSMTASAGANTTLSSMTRSGNVVTAVGANFNTGAVVNIYNALDATYNANQVAVTRVDATTFTYPSTGSDGSTTDLVASTKPMQVQLLGSCADNNYLYWLQSKTGGALQLVQNAGRNGQTSADALAMFSSNALLQPQSDAMIIFFGYNDFAVAHRTAAAVYADVVAMAMQAMSAGKFVVIISAIPWSSGATGTATDRKEALKYNRLIRAWCGTQCGARYADAAKYIIDATNATAFYPLSNMLLSDGVHPTPKGAEKIAQAVYDVVQYISPAVSRLVSSSADNYGADSTSLNIMDAAPWTTSGGAIAGGASGTCAAGIAVTMTGGGTAVCSVVSRSDGIGYNQRVVFTPSANNDSITFGGTGYITGRTSTGDLLNYLGQLSLSGMSGASIKSISFLLSFNGSVLNYYFGSATATSNSQYPASDVTLSLASLFAGLVPSVATGVAWGIAIKAGASGTALTVELGRQSIEKVT